MKSKQCKRLLFAATVVLLAAQAHATIMLQMNLGEITERADRIFRGSVVSVQPGSIEVGGGELPMVTYKFKVTELFKGTPTQVKGDQAVMEIRMVGSLIPPKADENGIQRMSMFRDVPRLQQGAEYLMFTTAESAAGLSVSVGLGQGAFKVAPVDGADGEFTAVNEFDNAGLGLSATGPVSYTVISDEIRSLLGQ